MSLETMESLLIKNGSFHRKHRLHPKDVEIANGLIDLIERTRTKEEPIRGDRIICCGPPRVPFSWKGVDRTKGLVPAQYDNGHLNKDYTDDFSSICVKPYTPFTFFNHDLTMPVFSTSGGYWLSCPDRAMYEYIGKADKYFCAWGHCGATANGAITFMAKVNVWKLFLEGIY